MKNCLTLIFAILFINSIFGQNPENKTELCVINMLGAKVYEKPTYDSKVLTVLEVGKTLTVENSIDTKEQFRIGDNFSLSGNWIKPNGINGFVFSSDLTDKKANVGPNEYGQINVNLRGKFLNEKSEEKQIKIENREYPEILKYKYYENETYTCTIFDGCFNHVRDYKNLTLSEVYHQMVSDYYGLMGDNKTWIPIFQGKEGNIIKFEGEGATTDLKIEIKENGIIIVSSYDCD